MPSLFGSRRRRRATDSTRDSARDAAEDPQAGAQPETDPPATDQDAGVMTGDGSLEWVGSDGVVVGGETAPPASRPSGESVTDQAANSKPARRKPTAPATEGLWEVIRPAAIVPEEAARQVLVELARRDLSNGGEWQSEPQLWSRYDGPMSEDGTHTPELLGTIHVTYGTPTKYEITLYRVTVTAAGVHEGWTVASLTDEALSFGGLTLAQCPRATVNDPPRPFTY